MFQPAGQVAPPLVFSKKQMYPDAPEGQSTEPFAVVHSHSVLAPPTMVTPEQLKAAVAVTFAATVKVHGFDAAPPSHVTPDQPLNTDIASGVAVRLTSVPAANVPPPDTVPLPPPVPAEAVVTVYDETASNVAVAVTSAVSVKVHGFDVAPLSHVTPDQLLKLEPAFGVAVRLTRVPSV